MDGFGYKNWGNNNSSSYNDESYEESPPSKYGGYGNKKGGGGKASSTDFDYDISSDFADSPVVDKYSQKGRNNTADVANSNRFSAARTAGTRTSIHDRTKEILERNKAVGKATQDEEDDKRLKSYQDTFKDLMEGLEIPSKVDTTKSFNTQSQSRMESTLDSPGGDSLDISAADMEVYIFLPLICGVHLIDNTYHIFATLY